MKFELFLDCANDAFTLNGEANNTARCVQIARILRHVANILEKDEDVGDLGSTESLRDENGNRVGHWEFSE